MALRKMNGHAVTSVLPPHADGASVAPANVSFPAGAGMTDSQRHVGNGNSYAGGQTVAKKKANFPPAK